MMDERKPLDGTKSIKKGPEEGSKRYNYLYNRILAGPEQVNENYSPGNFIIENKEDYFTSKKVNN